jgi:Transposase IS66 family
VLPKSTLGKACDYLLSQWAPLIAHLHHGESRLDNNLVENAIRPSCIGKKNWLFIGHPDAGQRSAILYSLIVSCQVSVAAGASLTARHWSRRRGGFPINTGATMSSSFWISSELGVADGYRRRWSSSTNDRGRRTDNREDCGQ